jgi:hypothetical protein
MGMALITATPIATTVTGRAMIAITATGKNTTGTNEGTIATTADTVTTVGTIATGTNCSNFISSSSVSSR